MESENLLEQDQAAGHLHRVLRALHRQKMDCRQCDRQGQGQPGPRHDADHNDKRQLDSDIAVYASAVQSRACGNTALRRKPDDDKQERSSKQKPSSARLVNLMRWSGLSITDAVTLGRDRLGADNRLELHRTKTRNPVYLLLRPEIAEELRNVPPGLDVTPTTFSGAAGARRTKLLRRGRRRFASFGK
jgi:hypothetical protein